MTNPDWWTTHQAQLNEPDVCIIHEDEFCSCAEENVEGSIADE